MQRPCAQERLALRHADGCGRQGLDVSPAGGRLLLQSPASVPGCCASLPCRCDGAGERWILLSGP